MQLYSLSATFQFLYLLTAGSWEDVLSKDWSLFVLFPVVFPQHFQVARLKT